MYLRHFNGKAFHLGSGHTTKASAKEEAALLRGAGYYTRIVRAGKHWDVWVRRKDRW